MTAAEKYLALVAWQVVENRIAPFRCCTNPQRGMAGPYVLDRKTVESVVGDARCGWYWLGREFADNVPQVNYVGRSDTSMSTRLLQRRKFEYKFFWFRTTDTVHEAFDGECWDWHQLGGEEGRLDNDIHPDEPDDHKYPCPIPGCDERRGREVNSR